MTDERNNECKSEEVEVEAECVIESVNKIENELRMYIFAESTKVNKNACATILARMSQVRVYLEKEVMKNKFLEGRVYELEKRVRECRNVDGAKDIEGVERKEEIRTTAQQKSRAVVVKANRSETDEGVNARSDSVKKDIITKVEPMLTDVRVKAMRRLKNGRTIGEKRKSDRSTGRNERV
ncbi:hypothetical protein Zmor_005977 [Zophobas morio]|uniref:Uncharacterized protein n=1 Tax=Zophobas morio TaxID=2755281 RepID=A0AA38IWC0_9CUCU|nr:hypothetical protein Zmor_005977 [Zophobas morio]